MTKEMPKRKSREIKYAEIITSTIAVKDENPNSSLEQPTPLEIVRSTTSSKAELQESNIDA